MKHYSGKLFQSQGKFDQEVLNNFKYLGSKIAENKIWNPTLSELITQFDIFDKTILDCDENGTIFIKNNFNLIFRTVNNESYSN